MIGTTISQYRILERIGAGGMGVVYKAEDLELGRTVAIKILPPELAEDEAAKERFKHEARTASSLDHANVCTIYQAGETEDGQIFLAMAFYEGETLRQRIARGRLPTGEAIEITAQIAHGLSRAHAAGIFHRDIKPANIIITEHGEAKILDFGLARLAEGARLTREGTTVGTPAYMAPEQVRGEETDGRADVWSLGVVLFEMLTGELPFKGGAESAVIYAILNDLPTEIGELRPDLPEAVRTTVERALTKDPGERLRSAAEVLAALHPVRGDTPTEAFLTPETPTAAMPASPDTVPRPRRGRALALALAVLVVVLGGAWLYRSSRPVSTTPARENVPAVSEGEVVTILPFTFRGSPEFAYLGDGIVDLLGTKLDGAGDLRTSDPHAVLSLVQREDARGTDPAKARQVAGQFGATYFITGEILEASGSLHISASLYEHGETEPVAAHSVEGPAEELFGLVDRIAGSLLAEQIQAPSVKVFSTAAMTTESLPALKSYLRAENELRRGEFTKALGSYQETVELDPEFALAWYRLSVAAEWSTRNELVQPAVAKALEFGDRLSAHDRDLLEARLANRSGDPERAEQIYRSILGRYPDDVEAWVQMSEILSHYGYMTGRSMVQSREALEKVIHYEPGFVGSWWHLARVAAVEGKTEEVDEIVRRIVEMNPEGERSLEVEALRAVVLGEEDTFAGILEQLEDVEDHVVLLTAWGLAMTSADPHHAIEISRILTHPRRSGETRAVGHVYVAWLEISRGRLEEALRHLGLAGDASAPRRFEHEPLMRLLPWLPSQERPLLELRAELEAWNAAAEPPSVNPTNFIAMHDPLHELLRAYLMALIDRRLGSVAPDGDVESAALAEIAETLPDGIPRRLAEFLQHSLRAERLRRAGDPDGALAALEAAEFGWAYQDAYASPYYAASLERWMRAELLREAGRLDEALTWYSTFGEIGVADEAFFVPAAFRRATILEERGETGEAIELYRLVMDIWNDADPALRVWTERARERVAVLEVSSAPASTR